MLFRYLGGLLLGVALAGQTLAAGLEAMLDRNRVAEGDTVTLSLSAPGDVQGSPDLGPLAKDFDIVDQSQSSRMTIVNGRSSSSREWQLILSPKHGGRLVVPAIKLAGLSSEPLPVEVLSTAQAGRLAPQRPVFVETEVAPKAPYVQGQTVYTVRVLYRVPLREAGLTDPKAGDAILKRLGDDRSYSTMRGGRRYNVLERRYALFPQHSGTLQIDAPVLSASVPEERPSGQGRGRGPFGRDPFGDFERIFGRDPFGDMDSLFDQTRPIHVRGPSLTLDVKPQPPGTATPWLPAESVQLSETWSPDPPKGRVGEPLTRTIAITAQGVTAAQIPDLQPSVPDGVKVYPDKAQTKTRPEGDDLVAMKVLKQALVPSKAGRVSLPEVRLPWWDTRTGRQEVAVLPARTLEVLPAPAGATPPAPTPVEAPAPPRQASPDRRAPPVPGPRPSGAVAAGASATGGYWPWIAAVLALGWLGTFLLWLGGRRTRGSATGKGAGAGGRGPASPGLGTLRARVQDACNRNDPRAAREALLAWAAARWPEAAPRRLDDLAERLGEPAARLLGELDRRLYGAQPSHWDGRAAWAGLAPSLDGRAQAPRPEPRALPELYPEGP